jgi:hypothetical protein
MMFGEVEGWEVLVFLTLHLLSPPPLFCLKVFTAAVLLLSR